jgi:ABC-type uncharacterized transport system substrate-binding protein
MATTNGWLDIPVRGGVHGWVLLLALVLFTRSLAGPARSGAGVVVVISNRAAAYQEAVEALRSVLAGAGVGSIEVTLDRGNAAPQLLRALEGKPELLVAVGSPAAEAVGALDSSLPVVATMVLGEVRHALEGKQPAATIALDLPPDLVLSRLKQLYPKKTRIAVARGPGLSDATVAAIRAQARELGYEVQILECPGPKQLLEGLGPLRGHADFLWCFPDSALYAGPVVSELILRSIRVGLPLIGFSEGMVRAGALIGFYPDYGDVGRQTAEAVLRMLQGDPLPARHGPRKFRGAVNERVMRVLGLEPARGGAGGLEVVR